VSAARRSPSFQAVGRRAPTGGLFALIALACVGAVAAALVSQHVYGMDPCAWCILDRLIFLTLAGFAVLGLAWRSPAGARVAGTFSLMLAVAGIAAAIWLHFVASKTVSCKLTLADRIVTATQLDRLVPGVFEARASCADAAVSLLGISYDYWAAAAFAFCAVVSIRALRLAA